MVKDLLLLWETSKMSLKYFPFIFQNYLFAQQKFKRYVLSLSMILFQLTLINEKKYIYMFKR